ncbi:MAG: hydrogen gas-evolving membrane-bound hydrogenase subunit E [Akkermansiaceae bacterium]
MELTWLIAGPLLAALFAPWLVRLTGGKGVGAILSVVPFAITAWLLVRAIGQEDVLEWSYAWLPALGVEIAFRLDGHATLFLLLVSFIGGLICIYGGAYLKGDKQLPRFFALLFLFMASMLGIILADDVILTFVFWELTSITSFLLVGYKHYDESTRKAALQALLVTVAGGLAMLVGLIITSQITGTTRISEFPFHAQMLGESPLFPAALCLILLGVFTKSAQVPFHFWLPGAMAAPTPVSAYLHSATMVKAGVILLAKLSPAMAHTDLWTMIIPPVGIVTMLTGAVMAVVQHDLKKLLAYSTISTLGALVMLLGFGDPFSLKTALFLVLVHGLYKGSLFMIAGTVDHATGTRNVNALSGLGKTMPVLAIVAAASALSMSGVPPTLGFISKELIYETRMEPGPIRIILASAAVLANVLGVAVALIVGVRPFLQRGMATPVHHLPCWGLVLPPAILAGLGLALGLVPGFLDRLIVSPAVLALGGDPQLAKLTLWHGWTLVLALSGLTLVLGFVAYWQRHHFRKLAARVATSEMITPSVIYKVSLEGTLKWARLVTDWLQNGRLSSYVRVTFGAGALLVLYALGLSYGKYAAVTRIPAGIFDTAAIVIMSASAVAAVLAQGRLAAILCLGGVGYSVALLFVAFGAPDLAITQLLVETLTVVMFSFVILKIPQIRRMASARQRRGDAVVATLFGLAMTLVVWKALHVQVHASISPGLVARSATEAFGRNVVNVILVDFRALDTLGEILVLAIAGLGVTALLARKKRFPRPLAGYFKRPRPSARP